VGTGVGNDPNNNHIIGYRGFDSFGGTVTFNVTVVVEINYLVQFREAKTSIIKQSEI
jgi:hypothetical protein